MVGTDKLADFVLASVMKIKGFITSDTWAGHKWALALSLRRFPDVKVDDVFEVGPLHGDRERVRRVKDEGDLAKEKKSDQLYYGKELG